ncbi:MAG: hypothetical protein DHS20C20_09640 [Ardenticatenaceae bacterium]|nr:MAG: hypothetical protein DHS20C20_09640 [Ardenticatenaceae bacterium]
MPNQRITTNQRKQVRERAKGCCEYCRSQEMYATESFSIDHILPRVQGGKTKLDNLAYACLGCNSFKSSKIEALDPATNDTVSLFNPRRQKWAVHFTWSTDLTEVLGTTPTGRATIVTLKMNRESLINLRRLLLLIEQHPPDKP